ncbi:Synaptic vesicle glycoprotein 2C [Collichthys lucidus]|uniref:Synaptic vesicle glycoprotein 2C n=1 Tax=Collichthys lucidus TaxID=240159 RepID=A0A4V6ARM1_COLLU|nr:Synaptic vesicle glycoprotein 2C [Collichthys lucidus]
MQHKPLSCCKKKLNHNISCLTLSESSNSNTSKSVSVVARTHTNTPAEELMLDLMQVDSEIESGVDGKKSNYCFNITAQIIHADTRLYVRLHTSIVRSLESEFGLVGRITVVIRMSENGPPFPPYTVHNKPYNNHELRQSRRSARNNTLYGYQWIVGEQRKRNDPSTSFWGEKQQQETNVDFKSRSARSTTALFPPNSYCSIVYLGMMFGAFFWGGLSDKLGRKQCLLISMSVNGFFAFLSSFVQGYSMFLLCRMVSGFGLKKQFNITPDFTLFLQKVESEAQMEDLENSQVVVEELDEGLDGLLHRTHVDQSHLMLLLEELEGLDHDS